MPAKKTTKKSTTKKSTAKKTARTRKKKVFHKVEDQKTFRLVNGEILSHYIELADALAEMEEHVLSHHVGQGRHDFANWVAEVFNDTELAAAIEPLNTRQDIRLAIYRHLVHKHLQ